MRVAPLASDCIVCWAPEPTRVAINAAIWPGEAMIRSATYRAAGVQVARTSGVPGLAKCNPKTITRHVDHVESSWREITAKQSARGDEVPVKGDLTSLVDQGGQLAGKAMDTLDVWLGGGQLEPKDVIAIAKLGVSAATTGEKIRLASRQQKIDVLAIFAASSGHLPPMPIGGPTDDEDDVPIDVLRAALTDERRQLADRNE